MPRWKQRFVCLECAHSAWREVMTDAFDRDPPNIRKLEARGFYCSFCGTRHYRVIQVQLPTGRWSDAFKPGGMVMGLMEFNLSARRDADIHEALQKIPSRKRFTPG